MTVTSWRQRLGIHGEAVVLRGDLDLAGLEFLDRMIRAAVAELQLEGLAAERQPEDLVAEADAEHRHVGLDAARGRSRWRRSAPPDRPGRC